jgi:hypothetical protein
MAYWELFQDTGDIGHYIEIRIADTWTDHIRQHERVTKNVQVLEDRIRVLLKDGPQPTVSHYRKIYSQIVHPTNQSSFLS